MAPNTALNLLLVGTALLLLETRRRGRALLDTCLLLSAVVSLTGVVGYAYGVDAVDGVGAFVPMELNAALAFLLLAGGVASARPLSGWTAVAAQDSFGGVMVRRLLPPSILGVALLGWLRLAGERAGLYSGDVGLAMFSSTMIAALAILIVSTANYLHHAEVRRRGAEARAQESVARLAAIVESSDDAITSEDLQGIICTWNPAAERIYGYSADQAIGRSATLLVPRDQRHEIPEILGRTASGERIADLETVRVRQDGIEIDVSLTVSPVRAPDGRVTGVSVIARDITGRKQEEQAIRERRWLAGVGATALGVRHEINNPLATLLTSAALLDMGSITPEEEREMVQTIAGEARRIRDVLLRLSDIQDVRVVEVAGSQILDLSPT